MKNGKLTKEDVGLRFRKAHWDSDNFFILSFLDEENNFAYGISKNNTPFADLNSDWLLWEGKKKTFRIEAGPAVIRVSNGKSNIGNKEIYHIPIHNFTSKEAAEKYFSNNNIWHFIKWPADFDKEKGVWFYEWEE